VIQKLIGLFALILTGWVATTEGRMNAQERGKAIRESHAVCCPECERLRAVIVGWAERERGRCNCFGASICVPCMKRAEYLDTIRGTGGE